MRDVIIWLSGVATAFGFAALIRYYFDRSENGRNHDINQTGFTLNQTKQ